MANDLGTIGIAIEVRGRDALRQIERDMDAVDLTAKSAARSFEAFERAGLKTAETFRYMSDQAKKRLADEQRLTQEIIKQRNAAEQLARANAQMTQAQIGSNLGLGARGISASASAGAYEAEIERLRQKFDQTYVAAQLYQNSLAELNRAHMLGVTSAKQHEAAVESLRVEYQAFQTGAATASNRFSQYTAQNASSMNQFGVVVQQAGYQVGDFLVQIQSGTNPLVAFGQQATQLVGILPLMGAGFMGLSAGALVALSAGLGIAIPLVTAIGAAFMRTGENANEGAGGVDNYTKAMEALTAEIQRNQEAFLQLKFDTESSGVARSRQEMEDLRNEIPKVREQVEALNNALRSMGPEGAIFSLFGGDSGLSDLEERLALLESMLSTLEAQEEAQQMLNGGLSVAAGIQQGLVYDKEVELKSAKELQKEHAAQLSYMGKTRQESDNFVQSLISAYTILANSRGVAAGLADEMARAASARQAALVGGGRSMTRGGPELDPYGFRAQLKKDEAAIARVGGATRKLKEELSEAEKAAQDFAKTMDGYVVSAVDGVANAFGDFVTRGFKDFKGFVKDIIGSFKNMIAQMIAIAVKNKILIGLGFASAGAGGAGAIMGSGFGTSGLGGMIGTAASGFGSGFMSSVTGGFGGMTGAIGGGLSAGGIGGISTAIGAVAAPLLAVAGIFSFFKKKTKELDSGLRITVNNMDALVETFKTVQTTRFFGLSKKTTTTVGEAGAEISDPIVKAVQDIQTQVLKAAEMFGIAEGEFADFVYKFDVSLKGLTDEQKIQKVNEELLKMGDAFASLSGHFTTMNELLAAAQQRYDLTTRLLELQGNAEELLRRNREAELAATHELNRGLLTLIHAMEDVQMAAQRVDQAASNLRSVMDRQLSAAQSGLATARSQLEKAVGARVASIQSGFARIFSSIESQIDSAKAKAERSRRIFELLDNALSGRSATSEAGAFASRRAAMTYVSSGGMDVDKLTSALGILNEPSEQFFGTFQDYARDFALTTNAIEKSRAVAEASMTADERAVQLLERQLEQARVNEARQIAAAEKLLKINEEVLTVEEAMAQYMEAQATYEQLQAQHEELIAQFPMLSETFLSVADAILALNSAIAAQTAAQTAVANAIASAANVSTGNVPGFAYGGMHTGGPRIVGESGPELEVTGPSRIYSNRDTANMFRDPELASAMDGLRREVSGMRSEQLQIQVEVSKNVKRIYDIERKWDTDGLPPERV